MPDEAADPERGLTTTKVPVEATLRSLVDQLPLTVYVDRLDEVSSNVYTSPRLERELGGPLRATRESSGRSTGLSRRGL